MKHLWVLLMFTGLWVNGYTQGYEIKGMLKGYDQDSIFLGYYFADKQYLLDTAVVTDQGFTFSGDTLRKGVYLVVMPPDNRYFQIMVNDIRPRFSFEAEVDSLEASLQFVNSDDNNLFYDNLRFIAAKRRELEVLNARKASSSTPEIQQEVDMAIQKLNVEVQDWQQQKVDQYSETLTAALIKSGFQITLPEYTGTPEVVRQQQYLYYKSHYFDHVPLNDDRLIRAPQHVLFDRVNYYLEKLTPQQPDSIIQSLDYLLQGMEGSDDIYKYYLVKFLNDYAQSKIVGMDAVYVHLALEYYAKDKAPWVEEEQLKKIIANARDAEPTLIGRKAPDFRVQLRDSSDITLYEVEAPYLVLVFWAHDCGHCKESMPELKEFHEAYHDKGIEVMSVCTKLNADEPACWDFVDEHELYNWINASDKKGGRSFMHSLFYIKKTPKLFVLDADKKILTKDLNPEQLIEFFDQLLKNKVESGG